ncbi:hypothetical protein HY061_02150 [Candidatus Azambacteria bacterium]|nr:hypothetical protein [Candidatus Azambacteria bacterium]
MKIQIDSKQKQAIMVLAVVILVGVIGFSSGKKSGLQQGRNESVNKIAELNKVVSIFVPPMPNEIFQASGEIKLLSTSANTIDLEIISLQERRLPGVEPKKEIKKVIVSSGTEIIKIDFSNLANPVKSKEVPPGPKEIKIQFSDLRVGDKISVTSMENIKDKESFKAARIVTQDNKSLPIYPRIKN